MGNDRTMRMETVLYEHDWPKEGPAWPPKVGDAVEVEVKLGTLARA